MTYAYWFTGGFVTCLALTLWWFHGNLKEKADGWKTQLSTKIRGWLT